LFNQVFVGTERNILHKFSVHESGALS
jgi:hypothetical protein